MYVYWCLQLSYFVALLFAQVMADKAPMPEKPSKTPLEIKKLTVLKKVKFTVHTYPDLQPFLEMAVVLLEGVYEYMSQPQEQ